MRFVLTTSFKVIAPNFVWIVLSFVLSSLLVMASFTAEEVAKHCKEGDAWVIVKGNVYDVSAFLDEHPGGKTVLLKECGKDATKKFAMFHKDDVLTTHAAAMKIGVVREEGGEKGGSGLVFSTDDPSERPNLGLKAGVEEGPNW